MDDLVREWLSSSLEEFIAYLFDEAAELPVMRLVLRPPPAIGSLQYQEVEIEITPETISEIIQIGAELLDRVREDGQMHLYETSGDIQRYNALMARLESLRTLTLGQTSV